MNAREIANEILHDTDALEHFSDRSYEVHMERVPASMRRQLIGALVDIDDLMDCRGLHSLLDMLRDSLMGEPEMDWQWVCERIQLELEHALYTRAEAALMDAAEAMDWLDS